MAQNMERVLFVHAHPDDESITTGGTIATLVNAGSNVTVLTLTRGELGEVIPAELQHLLEDNSAIAAHRETELASAMRVLGVTDHRYLGNADARWRGLPARRYLDSGMRWGDNGAEALESQAELSLSAALLEGVVADIVAVIADTSATAVVSYDARGGYGHPDHERAHQAALAAATATGVPFYEVVGSGDADVVVDVTPVAASKRAALAAHRTQITLDGDDFVLSNGESQPIGLVESFRRVDARTARDGHEAHVDVPFRQQSVLVKIVTGIFALLLGALVGTLMTTVHQSTVAIAGIAVPWGVIVALLASGALIVGLRVLTTSRAITVLGALGVMGVTAFLATPTVGGSVLVPANLAGTLWTFAPAVVTLVALAWPNLEHRPGANG
ncbi:MAG: N-acetyl-D-myo-inositol-2-amino-2-deoxy-alpha-D-glucopyranoside deacetylase, partial [Microbacteriaceae bacterium]|nr:N-acetyl-D-myo-inositol-2-amino-2-deoxy-alpha-D-glucopyranoside deacetylase [Microbacteriaceae bacterium]